MKPACVLHTSDTQTHESSDGPLRYREHLTCVLKSPKRRALCARLCLHCTGALFECKSAAAVCGFVIVKESVCVNV